MRERFDTQLETLNCELILMGALIEGAIAGAVKALTDKDLLQAQKTISAENEVNQKEREIESLCLKLLLQQQPVAKDLRLISSALKMITDMERIGDQAVDISEIAVSIMEKEYIKKLKHIPMMARATIKMVTDSIDAFVRKDLTLARAVIEADDEVDELFEAVRDELVSLIREDASNGDQAMDFLMIAKYFERIGDHAVNIAEWVEFSITGLHKGNVI